MNTTLTVRGLKARTQSTRRFIVFIVSYEAGRPVEVVRIQKRSDSRATAITEARRYGPARIVDGGAYVATVIDRVTGEEIAV